MTINEAEYLYTYYTYVINIYTEKGKRTEQTDKQQTNRKTERKESNERERETTQAEWGKALFAYV